MKKMIVMLFLISVWVYSDEIEMLLDTIKRKSDLSEKTKMANSGVTYVWTRDDLDRMQITSLKQILKTIYPVGYNENRYGLPDPVSISNTQPFLSSQIRLFINNQEITSGLYGSGLFLMGDTNIDWVDHVEIYTQNPTFAYTVEPTVALIKLYTKSVVKDEGSKISIRRGSYGKKSISGYTAGYMNEWSYFSFVLADDGKRQKHKSHDTLLSRDKKANVVVATLCRENTHILLSLFDQKRDGFINLSTDGTPTESKLAADYIHMGIDDKIGNLSLLFAISYTKTEAAMKDDTVPVPAAPFYGLYPVASMKNYTHDIVGTGEINYNYHKGDSRLLTGLKYRIKRGVWDKAMINGIDLSKNRSKSTQKVVTLYTEEQYKIASNSLITAGVSFQRITNSDSVQNDSLWHYRIANTYTTKNWTFKTFYNHTLASLEPYLIGSHIFLADPSKHYKLSSMDTVVENIIYHKGPNRYEVVFDYSVGKNLLAPVAESGKIENFDKDMVLIGADLRWQRFYNHYDKFSIRAAYRKIKNVPTRSSTQKEMDLYTVAIRNINTYKKIDLFNELIYTRIDIDSAKNFYNYSLGVQYRYNDNITVTLKGLNVFDKAGTTEYFRINPQTLRYEKPLQISPIDRKVVLGIDWVF